MNDRSTSSPRTGFRALGLAAAALTAVLLAPGNARALSHFYEFTEIYSNATGQVQFIELVATANFQGFLDTQGNTISSTAFPLPDLDIFGADLPNPNATNGRFLLIGSTSYASAAGAVAADYTMPDNFFSVLGDTIIFQDSFNMGDSLTFTSGDIPTDGVNSAQISGPDGMEIFTSATNTPTNASGDVGELVPEPRTWTLLAAGFALLVSRRRRACE